MTDRKLPEGWRTTELLPDEQRVKEHVRYVTAIAKELEAIPRIKPTVPNTWQGKPIENLTQAEREAFHFSLQPKSTQEALTLQKTRKADDDIDHLLRPMPECAANSAAKGVNELINDKNLNSDQIMSLYRGLDRLTAKRALDPIDVILIEDIRHKARNTLGQSDGKSVDSEKRQRGIEAFTYSKPAVLTDEQVKKLTKLEEIVNTPLEPEIKKKRKGIFGALVDAVEFILPPVN